MRLEQPCRNHLNLEPRAHPNVTRSHCSLFSHVKERVQAASSGPDRDYGKSIHCMLLTAKSPKESGSGCISIARKASIFCDRHESCHFLSMLAHDCSLMFFRQAPHQSQRKRPNSLRKPPPQTSRVQSIPRLAASISKASSKPHASRQPQNTRRLCKVYAKMLCQIEYTRAAAAGPTAPLKLHICVCSVRTLPASA